MVLPGILIPKFCVTGCWNNQHDDRMRSLSANGGIRECAGTGLTEWSKTVTTCRFAAYPVIEVWLAVTAIIK